MLTRVLIAAIRLYQAAVSPLTPGACRFTPTCSEYARRSLEAHGTLRGGRLAVRRLLRCHPWGGRGYDPVPEPPPSASRPPAGWPSRLPPTEPPGVPRPPMAHED